MKTRLLLHACCAPCFGYVYELLHSEFDVVPCYYNPNIAPKSEYIKRYAELLKICDTKGIKAFQGEYDPKAWTRLLKHLRFSGEKSDRCWICYEFRLRRSFEFAKQNACDIVATTLSISPHKDADKINEKGNALSREFGIRFYEADFKQKDGFRKSLEISKEYGFYRQHYCGCIYSKLERDRSSLWVKNRKTPAELK